MSIRAPSTSCTSKLTIDVEPVKIVRKPGSG